MSLFAHYVKFCAMAEGQAVTLTFNTHEASFTQLIANTKFKFTGNNSFPKIKNFHFFPYKSVATKFDLDVNWVKVKPVII